MELQDHEGRAGKPDSGSAARRSSTIRAASAPEAKTPQWYNIAIDDKLVILAQIAGHMPTVASGVADCHAKYVLSTCLPTVSS